MIARALEPNETLDDQLDRVIAQLPENESPPCRYCGARRDELVELVGDAVDVARSAMERAQERGREVALLRKVIDRAFEALSE